MLTTYTSLGTIRGHNRYLPGLPGHFWQKFYCIWHACGGKSHRGSQTSRTPVTAAAVAHRLYPSWPWPPTLHFRIDQEPNW